MSLYELTETQLSSVTAEYLGLYNGKQYSIPDLEYIVKYTAVKLKTILITQKHLTESFCREYLLSDNYKIFDDDDIFVSEVIYFQPHLKECFNL